MVRSRDHIDYRRCPNGWEGAVQTEVGIPAGVNIYATFCFWLEGERYDIGHIPQLLALAAAEILEQLDFFVKIKWPNDLLLNSKKIGGILCETLLEKGKRGVVCGIGLNVNMKKEALDQINRPATSLHAERGELFDAANILENLQTRFSRYLEEFLSKGFPKFFPMLQQRSAFNKGENVRFHDNRTLIEAQFVALHPDGSIELQLSDGTSRKFYAGEFC